MLIENDFIVLLIYTIILHNYYHYVWIYMNYDILYMKYKYIYVFWYLKKKEMYYEKLNFFELLASTHKQKYNEKSIVFFRNLKNWIKVN